MEFTYKIDIAMLYNHSMNFIHRQLTSMQATFIMQAVINNKDSIGYEAVAISKSS